MNGISFIALDIETATGKRSTICEIGITIVEDSQIKEAKSWLIQPPNNEYWGTNIRIHGIKPEDTVNKPSLRDVWGEIGAYLKNQIVVAHNTAFDMYGIAEALQENGIPLPALDYFCSLRTAQRTFKLLKYSLQPLCESLGIEFEQHNRASSDSHACAMVMLKCLEKLGVYSFDELEQRINIRRGSYRDGLHNGQKSTIVGNRSKKKYTSDANPAHFDPDNYFYDKEVLFTGEMRRGSRDTMRRLVDEIGGHSIDRFRNSVDVLVEGIQTARNLKEDGKSSKQRKCEEKLTKGGSVEILSEDEFYERLGYWDCVETDITTEDSHNHDNEGPSSMLTTKGLYDDETTFEDKPTQKAINGNKQGTKRKTKHQKNSHLFGSGRDCCWHRSTLICINRCGGIPYPIAYRSFRCKKVTFLLFLFSYPLHLLIFLRQPFKMFQYEGIGLVVYLVFGQPCIFLHGGRGGGVYLQRCTRSLARVGLLHLEYMRIAFAQCVHDAGPPEKDNLPLHIGETTEIGSVRRTLVGLIMVVVLHHARIGVDVVGLGVEDGSKEHGLSGVYALGLLRHLFLAEGATFLHLDKVVA